MAAEEILEMEGSMSLLPRVNQGHFASLKPKVITRVGSVSKIETRVIVIQSRANDGCDMERGYIILLPYKHVL